MASLTALERLGVISYDMKDKIVRLLLNMYVADIIEVTSQEDRGKFDELPPPNFENGDVEIFVRFHLSGRKRPNARTEHSNAPLVSAISGAV